MPLETIVKHHICLALDIWSLGCVVLQMITGKLPCDGMKDKMELAMKILFSRNPPNQIRKTLSDQGKDFLMKCFAREPGERTGVTCNVTEQRVTSIDLENLGLEGTIAPHLGKLSFLNYLNLQNNSFFGSMPQEIGQLFRLRTLILGSNRIQGTIPASLSLCSRLSYLDLSINRLQGTIPSELGALSELEVVTFMENFLTGHIPSSFGNLSSLSNSDVKQFGGISNLVSLTLIAFEHNSLTVLFHLPQELC
ncbi:hypothetical protein V6N12_035915 [Hibiscus sabdariffa]|uniref:Protein kinase domain-containing protein n=1 Tax=Hibiscus sabdariffa TaxID=183260 RepID=A0ABR2EP35_9ROSI